VVQHQFTEMQKLLAAPLQMGVQLRQLAARRLQAAIRGRQSRAQTQALCAAQLQEKAVRHAQERAVRHAQEAWQDFVSLQLAARRVQATIRGHQHRVKAHARRGAGYQLAQQRLAQRLQATLHRARDRAMAIARTRQAPFTQQQQFAKVVRVTTWSRIKIGPDVMDYWSQTLDVYEGDIPTLVWTCNGTFRLNIRRLRGVDFMARSCWLVTLEEGGE